MLYVLLIDAEAVADIQAAISYYESKQVGLGKTFFEHIQKAFNLIQSFPFFAIRYDHVRCYPLSDFPYMVHYHIMESKKQLIIRAVLHTSSDPNKWGS